MRRMPTIADIAKEAGVAKSTVSRALNGSSRISEPTRKRVATAALRMKYEPNYLARNLSKRKTLTIGVILEDIMNPFYTEVAKGIETVLKDHGYTMLLTSSGYVPEAERELTRTLLRNKVDGVLITPVSVDSEAIGLMESRQAPFFIMNDKSENRNLNWIDSDNIAGGIMAAEYLLNLGHKRFMILRSTRLRGSRDRFEGFRHALEARRIRLDDQVVLGDATSRQDGSRLVSEFVHVNGAKELPSAIIAVNDTVALGAMESLFEHGIRVPDDVSIIGYDDIYIASFIRVPLTTVHQAKFRMGQIAATGLLHMLDGRQEPRGQQFLIKPRMVVRESCREPGR
jgi:DNA-binding LacI/PurR family transcriptional regulator